MYLDPGSAGLAVQAFFALVAALVATLSPVRAMFAKVLAAVRRRVKP